MTFLGDGDGDGTDGRTDKRTNGHMDRQTFLGKYYFRCNRSFSTLFGLNLTLIRKTICHNVSDESSLGNVS